MSVIQPSVSEQYSIQQHLSHLFSSMRYRDENIGLNRRGNQGYLKAKAPELYEFLGGWAGDCFVL